MTVFTQFQTLKKQKRHWKQTVPTFDYFIKRIAGQQALITRSSENVANMKRILILGSSGSGKSTLARNLGSKLELPVIHLDRHYWNPGWEPTPEKEWRHEIRDIVKRPSWIIDGNYRSTLNIRIKAADTIIFLDLPPVICAQRAVKRRFMYLKQPRPDISRGCKEKVFDPKFPKFVRWILNYPKRARPDVISRLAKLGAEKRIVWLTSTQDVNDFFNNPIEKENTETANSSNAASAQKAPIPQLTTD